MAQDSTAWSNGFAATCSLSPDDPQRLGRDGLLRLAFARRGDATVLRRCRYTLPLQALSPFTLDDGACYLLLLNPTGGVLGGDRLHTEIVLEEGARVCLSTPSATRVYRSSGAASQVETILRVGRGATLEYLPDHLIPHPGSRLRQSLRIEMEQGSRGIFFDGFSAGRIALDESCQFHEFDSRTEIFLGGRAVFANRSQIFGAPPSPASFPNSPPAFTPIPAAPMPLPDVAVSLPDVVIPSERFGDPARVAQGESRDLSLTSPAALGRMGGYSYSGSLLLVADEFGNWRALLENLRAEIESLPGIIGGASLLAHSGCAVRYLAHSAIEFHAATERLWAVARRHLLGLPPLALRKC